MAGMLALGVEGGRVMLVDAATGEVKWDVRAHPRDNTQSWATAAMSPDGSRVASFGGDDLHWKLWDAASGTLHRVGPAHDGSGACICGVPYQVDDPLVVQEGCPVLAHTAELVVLAFSPCGQRLATGGEDCAVILWNAQTEEAGHRMLEHSGWITSLSFSADGAWLASGSYDRSIRVWDVTSGALLRTMPDQQHVDSVHFSPTSNRIAFLGSSAGSWDVDSGEMILLTRGAVFAVFSRDGRTIATANDFNDMVLLNAETGELVSFMAGHTDSISSASFSIDDGSKLASCSFDGTCKVWDSVTGALLRSIKVGAAVVSVVWGRDWVRDTDTQRSEAFAMGYHPRLGVGSQVLGLDDEELLRIILGKK